MSTRRCIVRYRKPTVTDYTYTLTTVSIVRKSFKLTWKPCYIQNMIPTYEEVLDYKPVWTLKAASGGAWENLQAVPNEHPLAVQTYLHGVFLVCGTRPGFSL